MTGLFNIVKYNFINFMLKTRTIFLQCLQSDTGQRNTQVTDYRGPDSLTYIFTIQGTMTSPISSNAPLQVSAKTQQ